MFYRAFRLSSNWSYFSEKKLVLSWLKYTDNLANSIISPFVAPKASDQPVSSPAISNWPDPIRVVLPFKDQASADIVRAQLKDLSQKIQTTVQSAFVSQKIGRNLKLWPKKLSHRLWTSCAMFTNLNVTCAMQVTLVSHVVIYTNVLKNTKTLLHQLSSIFATFFGSKGSYKDLSLKGCCLYFFF